MKINDFNYYKKWVLESNIESFSVYIFFKRIDFHLFV